ncbi:MAG: response regulator [Deltaproteobacteria bacterium]|nr:response regulator [Deltaproteobacteria bacterium]
MPETILVIEDEKDIQDLLQLHLKNTGYKVLSFFNGEEGLKGAQKSLPSLIILDLMLPGMDGLEVCRRLKKDDRTKSIPIVMLTAKREEIDRVLGFELGAEDYVTKPFSPRELLLRVKRILERPTGKQPASPALYCGPLKADFSKPRVAVNDKLVPLTAIELKLLKYLSSTRGRVQSRETLLDCVWGYNSAVNTRTVDAHVKRLRKKLGAAGYLIETMRGLGYRFIEEEKS